MSVGDVTSPARGSGARFNDGKPPYDLIPLRVLALAWWRHDYTDAQKAAHECLMALADWQETGAEGCLYDALRAIGNPFREAAMVMDYGRRKYADWNWSKGMPWSVCVGCASRHLEAVLCLDEPVDPESGRLHIGHVACNLIFLLQFQRSYPEGDDRPRMLRPAAP